MSGRDLKRLLLPSGHGGFGLAIAAVALASAIGIPFRDQTDADNLTMVYLTAVVVVSLKSGLAPALLATVLSVAAFNFLFTPPYYTFEALNPASYLTFAFMLLSSLLAALLASGFASRLASANKNYLETRHLLDIAQALLRAADHHAIEAGIAGPIKNRFGAHTRLLPADGPSRAETGSSAPSELEVPIMNGTLVLGSMLLQWPKPRPVDPSEQLELETIAALAAGALLRLRQAELVSHTQAEKESERLRNLLLSSLGHDLRTPLTVLSGTVGGLLRQRRKLPRDVLDDLTLLSRQIEDLRRFTANLLQMAAISSGQLSLNLQPYDMQELVGAALRRVDAIKDERKVRIDIVGPLPLVDADGGLMEQVLVNLFENAFKHTAADGTVHLRLARDGRMLRTSIADNGPGLPPGEEETVFERFRNGGKTQGDRSKSGHGLGLAICRGVIQAHGGFISAGNNPDGGACLSFTLPISKLTEGLTG